MAPRLPKGYLGVAHETIGSDILSLVEAVLMPEQVLGKELTARIRSIKANEWYPISMLLEPLEILDKRLGPDSLRRVGISLFKLSHEAAARSSLKSAHDVVYGLDTIYHHANRGTDIGGWKVLSFSPGRATVEKTTPHHCVMEEGILEAALKLVKVPALVTQTACFRKGAEACIYEITSHVIDERWAGSVS
jgi:hypothetical protein